MNKTKEIFLANVSHEIKTPLNAISGYSQMLSCATDEIERQQLTEKICKSSHELTVLINNILEISKIESGQIYIKHEDICPIDILEQIREPMRKRASDKGLSFGITIIGKLPTKIYTDKARISQILINLIGNAIKFTEKGHVNIEISGEESINREMHLLFKVIDTGIGISKKKSKKLISKFHSS